MTYWCRAISDKYETFQKPQWLDILEFYLSEVDIHPKNIFNVGHNDLIEIANRLEPISKYWCCTLHKISKIIKEIELDSDDLFSLPLLGGRFAQLCGKNMIHNNLSKPQDYGKATIFRKIINCKAFKTRTDFPIVNISLQANTSIVAS